MESTDLADVVYYSMAVEELYRAINLLPQPEKETVILIMFFPQTRVAHILRVDRSTVHRRFKRAVTRLREMLESRGITECPC